jgi:hypothetical protein
MFVGFTQDVAKYVKEQIVPKAPSLEFSMIALAGGFSDEKPGVESEYYHEGE